MEGYPNSGDGESYRSSAGADSGICTQLAGLSGARREEDEDRNSSTGGDLIRLIPGASQRQVHVGGGVPGKP